MTPKALKTNVAHTAISESFAVIPEALIGNPVFKKAMLSPSNKGDIRGFAHPPPTPAYLPATAL